MSSRILAEVATQDINLLSSAVHVISGSNSCDDLIQVIQNELKPLLKSNGVFITHFNEHTGESNITGLPDILKKLSSNLITLTNQIIINHNPSRYSIPSGMAIFNIKDVRFSDKIENTSLKWPKGFKSIAGLYDTPTPTIGLWIYRKGTEIDHFKQREIDILKYLQPILIQIIKSIIFQQEKKVYSNIAEHFLTSSEPKAVIKNDCSVVISNNKFNEQINQEEFSIFQKRLHKRIFNEINDNALLGEQTSVISSQVLFRLKRRLYEISISPVEKSDPTEEKHWLLTLKRTSDTDKYLSRSFQDANLTPRETEIILWLHKGLSCIDVARKLSLSYHTARTHVRNIYKKLGISSSRELLAFMSQPRS